MTLDHAQEAFEAAPTKKSAGQLLAAAMTYEADGMIGDDTFLDIIAGVRDWLNQGDDFS
jgi:hypothetical protein